ncbi:MAG: SRPBCC family protein [Rhodobacteraceae bacterium]|nr:SRPBCC family protein [Paracoccaceae bacterium]MCY4139337.1 SRPBCC family protein [Paracoccaceae bacterium]
MSETGLDIDQYTLKIDRLLNAPRAAVWRCWTEVDLFRQWFCPAPWKVPEADFDLRPGGRMNCVMAGPQGERIENTGIWLEIVRPTRLVFTDAFSENYMPRPDPFMTGFVELSVADQGATHMVWGARHATEAAMRQHLEMGFEEGWHAAADQLDRLAQEIA